MSWRPLNRYRDKSVAKLFNLRRAARAGLRIPPTVWCDAAELSEKEPSPPDSIRAPWIIRSASPTEDTAQTTAAGQFVSLAVADSSEFARAAREVAASLPRSSSGHALGAVFVQPLLKPERGGVAFFDGFAFECTEADGGNQALTAGLERGEVRRSHLERGDPFSTWLESVGGAFRAELKAGAIDVEYTRDGDEFTLLQARSAPFEVRRDPLLSLANHREILGEVPSPWMVSALQLAGESALDYFARIDPSTANWNDAYAVTVSGRSWLNFSYFFRLMDHWGLPRTFVTEGVGGETSNPLDGRLLFSRIAKNAITLTRLQWTNLRTVSKAEAALRSFADEVERARTLAELFRATVFGLGVALRTNFAINGALTGVVRLRRALGIRGVARVTTERMMEDYEVLRSIEPSQREVELDQWLARYGHRGPFESDLARPRFHELRDVLAADLSRSDEQQESVSFGRDSAGSGVAFWLDRRREWFRDELMLVWNRLRERVLSEAVRSGLSHEDVFLLREEDFSADSWPSFDERRREVANWEALIVPRTARRSQIEAAEQQTSEVETEALKGVPLSPRDFEGRVVRAADLVATLSALDGPVLDADTVLVVPALEPSWAVVFGRVGAVITDLGGELSHASILLREIGKPAIVNCSGAYAALSNGDRVRLEGTTGVVRRIP